MSQHRRIICAYVVGFVACMVAGTTSQAQQAPPVNGIYVIINPYGPNDAQFLQNIVNQGPYISCDEGSLNKTDWNAFLCISPQTHTASASGILLRIPWCDFEVDDNVVGNVNQSCHYTVQPYSSSIPNCTYNGPDYGCQVLPNGGDAVTSCSPYSRYDNCPASVLGAVLANINQINQWRVNANQSKLALSVGLATGWSTPRSVLNDPTASFIDSTVSPGGGAACEREPQSWRQQYLLDYETTIDTLLNYIGSTTTSPVTVLKMSGTNHDDIQYDLTANEYTPTAPLDPGPPEGSDTLVHCPSPSISTAQVWLNTYNLFPDNELTFVQAYEFAYGTIVGYDVAELAKYGSLYNWGATSVSQGYDLRPFGDIECGVYGNGDGAPGQCYALHGGELSPGDTNWRKYNFSKFIKDIFVSNSVANSAAVAAYQNAGGTGAFPLVPGGLSVNATALKEAAPDPTIEPECWLSNVSTGYDPNLQLPLEHGGPASITFNGIGTIPNWQTQAGLGGLQNGLSASDYENVMQNGITNGARFIEIETDAAADYNYYYYQDPNTQQVYVDLPSTLQYLLDPYLQPVCNYNNSPSRRRHSNKNR